MTRRIRFTPLLRAGVFAALAGTASAEDVPFTLQPPISVTATNAYAVALADLDRDGDLDVLSAAEGASGRVAWHENLGGSWAEHTIAAGSSLCARAHDLDGDGDLDVVATAGGETRIAWYENAAGNGSTWVARTVGTVAGGARSVHAADVDGDGDRDVLAASQGDDRVAWFENTAGNGTAWTLRTIATATAGADPFSVFSGDVDGDGDQDVLSASIGSDFVAWHENTTGAGTAWTTRTITTLAAGAASVHAADLDRDGDLDVLSASIADNAVAWYENTSGAGTGWTRHTISLTADGALSVFAADVDADGDQDAVAVALFGGSIAWYENTAGDGSLWTARPVATNAAQPFEAAVGDVDGDGDLDLVAAVYGAGAITWYRDEALHQTACFAQAAAVFTQAPGAYSLAVADLDGDGDPDPVSASYGDNAVRWYPNENQAAGFLLRTISTAASEPVTVRVGDVDGDGDPDVVASAPGSDVVAWFQNLPGDGWTLHTIATEPFVLGMDAADLDGDGDVDVLSAARLTDTVAWYDNTGGDGLSWTRRTVTTSLDDVLGVSAGDVDGDGDQDVIATGVTGTVAWFENTAGNGSAWMRRTIATNASGGAAVAAADLDGDGDQDVLSASYYDDKVAWYENTTGAGFVWTTRTISTAGDGTQAVAAADIDGDGDVDVLSASIYDDTVAWHENAAGNGTVWTRRVVSNAVDWAAAVATADLDGDGDPDLVSAARNAGDVLWHANGRGQFALGASNTAPPGAQNGAQVPMLRVVATHLGRIGDGDLELARFGVRVEEAPGDPYTTAEANAVIEALRVYRDANGNGVFDLGTDVQVAIVDQLALTGGAQAIAFVDGDPGVQVAPGPSRTYFVIAELTADASEHAPNNFRLVHLGLGPFAGAAEDRAYDIPLRPACPADVPSTVVVPITPVELTGFEVE